MNGNQISFPEPAHWIDGRAVPSDGPVIEVVNPATGAVIATVPDGTAADVDRAVSAATAAFPTWAAAAPAQRAAVLRGVAAGLKARGEEIAATMTAEMGAAISFTRAVATGLPPMTIESMAGVAENFAWSEEIANSLIVREPVGVVGAIVPWNFPIQQIVTKVVPALLAGNTVVLKPAEVAPLAARILAEVAAEAGLPAGVLNVVHGTGQTVGEAISAHPGIDMVSFTGSTRAGKRVSAVAAETVKRVALELGGKSASVILPDADLKDAVTSGLASAWANNGQICGAYTRMLVPAGLHDEVTGLLRDAAAAYTVGDPADEATRLGPLASQAQRERVTSYIERGIADGAALVVGGTGLPRDWSLAPTSSPRSSPRSTRARSSPARRSLARSWRSSPTPTTTTPCGSPTARSTASTAPSSATPTTRWPSPGGCAPDRSTSTAASSTRWHPSAATSSPATAASTAAWASRSSWKPRPFSADTYRIRAMALF